MELGQMVFAKKLRSSPVPSYVEYSSQKDNFGVLFLGTWKKNATKITKKDFAQSLLKTTY